jgi:hypothetical protein
MDQALIAQRVTLRDLAITFRLERPIHKVAKLLPIFSQEKFKPSFISHQTNLQTEPQ